MVRVGSMALRQAPRTTMLISGGSLLASRSFYSAAEKIDRSQVTTVEKEVLVEGSGPKGKAGQTAVVHYVGCLLDGKKFDSSRDRGAPFEFVLGAGQVIRGWDEGVATMNVGEKANLIVGPDFGYGARGIGPIPGNAVLVFEVEVIAFK